MREIIRTPHDYFMKQWLVENTLGISFWVLFLIVAGAAEVGKWWAVFIALAALAGLVKLMNHLAKKWGWDKNENA